MTMSYHEGEPREERMGKIRGFMRLLPLWMKNHPNWHLDVGKWLNTKEGGNTLEVLLRSHYASYTLGHMTMEEEQISEENFWDDAMPLAKEKGMVAEGDTDEDFFNKLKESYDYSFKNGVIINNNGYIKLSERHKMIFGLDEAMSRASKRKNDQK